MSFAIETKMATPSANAKPMENSIPRAVMNKSSLRVRRQLRQKRLSDATEVFKRSTPEAIAAALNKAATSKRCEVRVKTHFSVKRAEFTNVRDRLAAAKASVLADKHGVKLQEYKEKTDVTLGAGSQFQLEKMVEYIVRLVPECSFFILRELLYQCYGSAASDSMLQNFDNVKKQSITFRDPLTFRDPPASPVDTNFLWHLQLHYRLACKYGMQWHRPDNRIQRATSRLLRESR
jgi:hypothetical protein